MKQPQRPSVPLLRFFGAAGTVTGSRFLIDTPQARVLVDCGLFQGLKSLRLRNWDPFPIDPATIDAVLLTHAHLDHIGYLPALTRNGFQGPVFATAGTEALARIVLPDSGHLQEEDAEYANRKGYSKHSPALPLYTEEDAHQALTHFVTISFDTQVEVAPGICATFRPAGHILGSAMIALDIDGGRKRTIVFSGDLGRPRHPILRPPAPPPLSDVLLVESTYGNRQHEDMVSLQRFEDAIRRAAARGGMVVIPSFAVDRTEVILFHLRRLIQAKRVPNLPVYVDSPMALAALEVYRQALASGSVELNSAIQQIDDPFDPGRLIEARSVTQSMAINEQHSSSIIISASGMATGGRVLHHLANRLPDHRNLVLLVGFQAEGTRGRLLLEGARSIKMLGRYVPVRAEVINVPAFSIHADQTETLNWLRSTPREPDMVFVVHGEQEAAAALHEKIETELGWTAAIPRQLEQVRLD
jgi:metallo-beta-lactamase family protein